MEHQNINNVMGSGENVTSTYAEIYFNDDSCKSNTLKVLNHEKIIKDIKDEWISPSDLLIDIVDLKPPLTSKITRGKTHEGILGIGNAVLEKERAKFLSSMTILLEDNDAAWNHILINEKQKIVEKVKAIFLNIYQQKSEVMKQEISKFYEKSLQDLEEHLRSEIQTVLQSTRANVISHLNNEVQRKMRKERKILVDTLVKKYVTEIQNMQQYYKLLLDNELDRNCTLINKALCEKNDAVKAFYKKIEAERLTSTMYIMSLERKKCQIKKMLLENFQTAEITEHMKKIKNREDEIEALKLKDVRIADVNRQWEDKIKKILQLFLKFVSFSLKLLPEQTTFLLDLEKMVTLQLNEIQRNPYIKSTVLFEENEKQNVFEFPEPKSEISVCEKEPYVLVGDLSDSVPPYYGSHETLPSDVDLPSFRLDRQFVYAKCHGYENIKMFLDSQMCKCGLNLQKKTSLILEPKTVEPMYVPLSQKSESSTESLLISDFRRFEDCPVRKCSDWIKRNSFPYLPSYLDYNEENFKRVSTILGQIPKEKDPPKLIRPKDIADLELPFSATRELQRTEETQYSSQEDLTLPELVCPCIGKTIVKQSESHNLLKPTSKEALNDILLKRKRSLQRLFDKNPHLLQIFTDECFDYKL